MYDSRVPQTIFLLSPAHCGGKRARLLLDGRSSSPLAARLGDSGAPLGETFSFLSGLYFRGKLAYARAFHSADHGRPGVLVITPGRGLASPESRLTLEDLRSIAAVGVSRDDPAYHDPLARDAGALSRDLGDADRVVLLGSVATDKYVEILERSLGRHLFFPADFVGRGDMSRGGLMLRCVLERRELSYVPVTGAVRRGKRPPKLRAVAGG